MSEDKKTAMQVALEYGLPVFSVLAIATMVWAFVGVVRHQAREQLKMEIEAVNAKAAAANAAANNEALRADAAESALRAAHEALTNKAIEDSPDATDDDSLPVGWQSVFDRLRDHARAAADR